jgi:Flp pilus assembly protein TadB
VDKANSVSLIVALIAAFVAILGYVINQLQIHRERRAKVFAEALAAAVDYIHMPYVIGTRSVPAQSLDPKDRDLDEVSTRREIGNRLREVQAKLYFHQSLIQLESVQVAEAYNRLV